MSPDGNWLLFSSNRSGRYQIWIAAADGSSPRQVTNLENAQNPTMTADGDWIVFTSQGAAVDEIGIWNNSVPRVGIATKMPIPVRSKPSRVA